MIKSPGGATLGSSPTFGTVTATTVTATNLANVIARSAIPFVIAPTGTMANNGAITLGTALATTYANCYLNLPLNAIQAGSAAGWYFAQMTSATVGTVFNNPYSSGLPTIPATVPFVTTGPGAYTGVITAVSGPQITVPGGSIGPNGVLRIFTLASYANNANGKTLSVTFGGATVTSTVNGSVAETHTLSMVYNRGSVASQVFPSAGSSAGLGTASATPTYATINTAAAQIVGFNGTLTTATDYLTIEGFLIEAVP